VLDCFITFFSSGERISVEGKEQRTMSFLFGSRKTPQEMLRENQRMITRSVRELDRERTKMESQEKKIVADIKKAAKAGQMVLFFFFVCFRSCQTP
jgi:hypothetical protein